jgi:hypothetical protein
MRSAATRIRKPSPERTFTSSSSSAVQRHRTSHSWMMQNFSTLDGESADFGTV